jgi:hypothetical protein
VAEAGELCTWTLAAPERLIEASPTTTGKKMRAASELWTTDFTKARMLILDI